MRKANLDGVYDTNTNMMFYPQIMQPTHVRWEQIPPPPMSPTQTTSQKQLINGLPNGDSHLPNGITTNPESTSAIEHEKPTIFTPIPPVISNNFTILDTVFSAPPISGAGYPGPDGHVEDFTSGPNGLSSVPDDLVDELPADCRRAFDAARNIQDRWRSEWGAEADRSRGGALRGDLAIGYVYFRNNDPSLTPPCPWSRSR